MNKTDKKRIVVIGGGTGTFVALTGLKYYPLHLSAIITMMDSGGSTGRLRDQLGVLPPGDLRQALVALSRADTIWRDLFVYRFENGDLNGHNFGNIFLSALEKITGSMEEAIEWATTILNTQGDVFPVTYENAELCVELTDGKKICGETNIDEWQEGKIRKPIARAYLQPDVSANPAAIDAIKEADLIVIGPGDLYTSIVPNLLVRGIREAIASSSARKVYVMNLMTKNGQTESYTARKHVQDLVRYTGDVLQTVLVNTQMPDQKALMWYRKAGEEMVQNDLQKGPYDIVLDELVDTSMMHKTSSDVLRRSLIRHDPHKLASALVKLL